MKDEGLILISDFYAALGETLEEIHSLRREIKHLKEVNEILYETIKIHKS